MIGYYMVVRDKGYFLHTTAQSKTKTIVQKMIAQIGAVRGISRDMVYRCMQDKECIDYIRQEMVQADMIKIDGHYRIENKNLQINFTEDQLDKTYIVFA